MFREVIMYKIEDNHGLPMCGYETIICNTWEDVETYFEDEDAMARLDEGYARIIEI